MVLNEQALYRYPSGLQVLQGSRPFLEDHIRHRVRTRDGDGEEEVLPAALVVDATGRGSRSPRWLEEAGYDPPEEERVGVDVRYMSRPDRWMVTLIEYFGRPLPRDQDGFQAFARTLAAPDLAALLDHAERERGSEPAPAIQWRRYDRMHAFRRAAQMVEVHWAMAVGSLRFDGVEGLRTPLSRALNWYVDRVLDVAARDRAVAEAFITVKPAG